MSRLWRWVRTGQWDECSDERCEKVWVKCCWRIGGVMEGCLKDVEGFVKGEIRLERGNEEN